MWFLYTGERKVCMFATRQGQAEYSRNHVLTLFLGSVSLFMSQIAEYIILFHNFLISAVQGDAFDDLVADNCPMFPPEK